MNKRLEEILAPAVYAIPIADCDTTLESAEFYEMGMSRKVLAVAYIDTLAAGQWFEVQLRQDVDASGATDPEDLGDEVRVLAPAGGGPVIVQVEADVSEMNLAEGKRFVGVAIESEAQCDAGAVLIFGDNRYNPA